MFSSIYSNLGSSGASASLGYGGLPTGNHRPTTPTAKPSLQQKTVLHLSKLRTAESKSLIPQTQKLTIQVDTPPKQNTHQGTLPKAHNENTYPADTFSDYRCGLLNLIFMMGLIMLLFGSLFAFLFWISKALVLKIIFGFVGGILLLFGFLIIVRFFLDLFI